MNHHEQPGKRPSTNGKPEHPDDVPSKLEKEADRERQAHPARTYGGRERSTARTDVESTHDAGASRDIERERAFNPAQPREADPRASGIDRELPRRD